MLTELKTQLITSGNGSAIELLNLVAKVEGFADWLKTKSTIKLMQISAPFAGTSIYNHRTELLAFDNDVAALDSAIVKIN